MLLRKYPQLIALLTLLVLLPGCATLKGPPDPHDPWERFNRTMYSFNDAMDRAVLKPVAKGYRFITPNFIEKGVSNFFSNLGEVQIIANDLLQFKLLQALADTGRLLINSTIGIGGLFDVATPMGLKKNNEDFGQTLGKWAIGSGPYLVLPFFGPSSPRDSTGLVVDYRYFDPIREVDNIKTRRALYVLDAINLRAQLLEAGVILDQAAYDPYIFMREAYIQRRRNLIYDGNPPAVPIEGEDDEFDIFADD
jgi:phospholipid-binding lipoprotein MlaA